MRKNRTHFIIFVLVSVMVSSCEKVIQLDLNRSVSQLVIQGNIYNEPGPYSVRISKTVNFDTPNIYPAVTNATVTISDMGGQPEELSQTTDGTYVTSTLQGVIGHTYTLTVKVDGKTYISSSTMPESVNIDSIYLKKSFFGGDKLVTLNLTNTPDRENFYRVIHFINGKQDPGFSVFSENASMIESLSYSFMTTDLTPPLVAGDKIDVWLECIDKDVFEYFRTANRNGGQSTTPANPVSNISNGALGYFNACSVNKKLYIYQL